MLTRGAMLQNRYRVIRQLGGGGQAIVYLAEDLNLGVQRAVKELLPDPAVTPQERQAAYDQFRVEARILASLNHPNLARVWDHFQVGDNAYLVMDYIDGQTLQEVLDQTPGFLPEAAVLRWAGQLCDVLDYLHRQPLPIIFRDLKPSNVMLDRSDTVKLIDFGIARHFKGGKAADTVNMGTPGYAPLEQHGRGQTDARSDIYALGATLYHLLTKHEPEPAPVRVIPGQPDPLRPARAYSSRITPTTEAALERALAADPGQRFQSAREMKHALTGRPVVRGQSERRWILVGVAMFFVAGLVYLLMKLDMLDFVRRVSSIPYPSPAVVVMASDTPTLASPLPIATHTAISAFMATSTLSGGKIPTTVLAPTRVVTLTPLLTSRSTAPEAAKATSTPTMQSTATPTRIPTPTHAPTVLPSRSSNTPTPKPTLGSRLVEETPAPRIETTRIPELIEFKIAIGEYRLAEKAALRRLDPAAIEQLPTFAHGEALAAVMERIEQLKADGLYQELSVQQLDIQQVVLRDHRTAGALVQERYSLRTYRAAVDGDRLIDEEVFEGVVVYGLIYADWRWKVERIRLM
ncbi:MAG: hypothetical protein FJ280_11610 [Planctomycetes bacterium]|nr:hypothetical protein [Planctomycetota bacterium]